MMEFSTTPDFEAGEIFLVDKPYKWTSFDVVNYLRNFIRIRFLKKKIKVGHAGTLDPLATGLLIICTGKKTKSIEAIQGQEKEYTGTFVLGAVTPSYDLETEISERFPYEHINDDQIRETADSFPGTQQQIPPIYSAIKIKGKRAYEYARENAEEQIQPSAREITISYIEITRISLPEVDFRVKVSKGTYIRTLVFDFGKKLGSGAYLKTLRRTKIGHYNVEDARDPKSLAAIISETADTES